MPGVPVRDAFSGILLTPTDELPGQEPKAATVSPVPSGIGHLLSFGSAILSVEPSSSYWSTCGYWIHTQPSIDGPNREKGKFREEKPQASWSAPF